jgi:hypothetical protein
MPDFIILNERRKRRISFALKMGAAAATHVIGVSSPRFIGFDYCLISWAIQTIFLSSASSASNERVRFPNSVKPSFGPTWKDRCAGHRPADGIHSTSQRSIHTAEKGRLLVMQSSIQPFTSDRESVAFSPQSGSKKVVLPECRHRNVLKNVERFPVSHPSPLSNISCFVLLVSISYLLLTWRPKSALNCFVPRLDFFSSNLMDPLIRQTTSFEFSRSLFRLQLRYLMNPIIIQLRRFWMRIQVFLPATPKEISTKNHSKNPNHCPDSNTYFGSSA